MRTIKSYEISLDDELEANASLDVFKFDPNYEENEKKYSEVKKEILGEESSSSDESDSDDDAADDESGSDHSSDDEPANRCADDNPKHHRRHGNQPC